VKGATAGRILIAACAATVVGALAGVGLGHFAAGGVPLELIDRDGGDPQLGRPEALSADGAETAYAGPPPIIPTICEGCGPSLEERKAMARDRATDAEIARNEAMLRRAYADDVPIDADVSARPPADRIGQASPPRPFGLTGASAALAETAEPTWRTRKREDAKQEEME